MRNLWPIAVCGVLAVAGCRTPKPTPVPATLPPAAPPLEVPVGPASSLEPDYAKLPAVDATVVTAAAIAPGPPGWRPLTEEVCRREAAARATLTTLVPTMTDGDSQPSCEPSPSSGYGREFRENLVAESRNRDAAAALRDFYQLADAQGRGEVVGATLPVLDRLRATVKQAKADKLRVPVDLDDLDRQRAALLTSLSQADAGARQLDIDLKRRLGVPSSTLERLRPAMLPPVTDDPIDVEAAVRTALAGRPDLRALRAAYFGLNAQTLPQARSLIRGPGQVPEATADAAGLSPALLRLGRLVQTGREKERDAATRNEVDLRRRQLFALTLEREAQAESEVRAAAAALTAQTKQVALAKWRAEQLTRLIGERQDQGPLAVRAAELEAARARADVVAGVMLWHQNRVKLLAAEGLLGGP